jgi:MoaA/NifB/PqqE/SkfB family radical SAM enzyme
MSSYWWRLGAMTLRDPRKLRTMARLKIGKVDRVPQAAMTPPPFVVAVRLNYGCNLRCVMCNQWGENGAFIKTPDRMVKREMGTEDFKRFFDHVSSFHPFVYFTGGEPLMNHDILEVVEHASRRCHLVTSMSTNATYLKQKGPGLIDAGLDYLYTSLDAPAPSALDPIRVKPKGEDSNQEAVEAIKGFLAERKRTLLRLPIVQVQTIIVNENQHSLLAMAEFLEREVKPDVWGIQLCVYTTPELNQETSDEYNRYFGIDQIGWGGFVRDFPDMDYEAIQRQLDEISRRRWSFKLRFYTPLKARGFDLKRYFTKPAERSTEKKMECLNPYVFAQLQPNGDIAFCGSQPDYVIGNVKEQPFLELWNNEKARRWRGHLDGHLFAACQRCFSLHEFNHFEKKA